MEQEPWQEKTCAKENIRFDSYLVEVFPELTRSRAKKLIEDGHALLNNQKSKASHKLKSGDVVHLQIPAPESVELIAENIPLDILHEDEDIIVINKQAGLVVHPAAGNWSGTLVNALMHHCGDQIRKLKSFNISGEIRPGIVHRIDKNTSGIIVVAKNDYAHSFLAKQFRDHSISRRYHALCWGIVEPKGEWNESIARHPQMRQLMSLQANGKKAITKFRRLESLGVASLIEATLLTGRTHQIRVHASFHSHPLIGDITYDSVTRSARKLKNEGMKILKKEKPELAKKIESLIENHRQLLHATHLGFIHPNGEKVEFNCEAPADFQNILQSFQKGS